MKERPTSPAPKTIGWPHVILLVSILVALYVIVPQFGGLQHSFTTALTSNIGWLLLALVCLAGTYLTAAGAYYMACRQQFSYRQFLAVEVASGFVGRLLPANAAGLALNAHYISKQLGSKTKAAGIVALNNFLGFIAYALIVVIIVIATDTPREQLFTVHVPSWAWWLLPAVALGGLVTLLIKRSWTKHLKTVVQQLREILRSYRHQPQYLLLTMLMNMGTTCFYVLAFYTSTKAVGAPIALLQAFASFTLGLTGGAITPTPGGLGGVELGLYTGLYGSGLSSQLALSAVLVDRLIAYWLPIIPGLYMFRYLLKRKII